MPKIEVLIIDYGLGNLFNIQAAFASLGITAEISDRPADIQKAKRLIVPGVGAFEDGMKGLHERKLIPAIQEFSKAGGPILGICLGMQLLLSQSEEWGNHEGLGLVSGKVVKLRDPLPGNQYKIPHIGWNILKKEKTDKIFANIKSESLEEFYMYFLHSYFAVLDNDNAVIATTEYGRDRFCSAFHSQNIYGFQPHPERSGEAGLQMFKNFLTVEGSRV